MEVMGMNEDIQAVVIMVITCAVILGCTFVGVMAGDWFAGLFYRAGDHSDAATWTAHLVAFLLTTAVILSLLGRVFGGSWWFHD